MPISLDSSAVVSRITVARLHNLGDYEHVRYEVAVELPADAKPGDVLFELTSILNDAGPVRPTYDEKRARSLVARVESGDEVSDYDRDNLAASREIVDGLNARVAKQQAARERLNDLGAKRDYRDAKDDWDEE